jgi:DNA-binding protein H-NS
MANTASFQTSIVTNSPSKGKPHWRRTQQVYSVLNEAPLDATYNQLIQLVKEQTGQGCSRKLISKWKKERAVQSETVVVPELQSEVIPFVIQSQKISIFRYVIAASTIIMSLAGCSYLPIITKRPPIVDDNPTSAVVQTPVAIPKKPQQLEPREIKIELTLTNPQELKVKPGEQLTPGQVLSDRTVERERLLNQRKQLELSLKKLDMPIPSINSLFAISPLRQLPKISYYSEQANINLKQQELRETQSAIAQQQEKIKQLQELLPKSPEQTQQLSFIINPSSTLTERSFSHTPLSVSNLFVNRQSKSVTFEPLANLQPPSSSTQPQDSVAVIIEHEQAILKQLQDHQEKAQLQLQIAQSQLTAAQERRTQEEYQLHLEQHRRAIALQNQQLELERQRTIRAGQLQEQEYSKAQIQAKLQEVENAITQLSTVKAPYSGTVKKVKWKGQSDHTLLVELTLDVDDGSESRTATLSRQQP